ncbi:LysR family transcriptional regulator [Pacificimonas flava]|uniref:LysR family transcriptional regulator n=2 Tax=Pacificimonas TaxID=1960290 RepID=A0A219B3P1_9SPHN|nr:MULTISPECIES: LysR family transcriptional regulator [Pacificimonas]MBZ6377322.1 LysR family transcriptional regulator [Pacificimonas aurantium]OWV32970.1 LysR family transcriptional regulator [Pacificimonas flava]
MEQLDLDDWRAFVAVADTGTFTAGASSLGWSVPTVSKRVAALERRLGVSLFHRTSRRLALSPTGETVLPSAREHVRGLAAVEDSLRERDCAPGGRIRMSAPVSFSIAHLGGPLTSFLRDWPDIDLDLRISDETIDLVGGGFDLALRIGRLPDSSLKARKLCDIRMPLVAAPAYLAAAGRPQHPDDLKRHQAIVYAQVRDPTRWTFRHDLEGERTVEVSPRLTVDNGDLGLEALRAGLGLTVQPEFFIYDDLASGTLEEVMLPWSMPPVGAYIVTPPSALRPRRVSLLIEHLASSLARLPWAYGAHPSST